MSEHMPNPDLEKYARPISPAEVDEDYQKSQAEAQELEQTEKEAS